MSETVEVRREEYDALLRLEEDVRGGVPEPMVTPPDQVATVHFLRDHLLSRIHAIDRARDGDEGDE